MSTRSANPRLTQASMICATAIGALHAAACPIMRLLGERPARLFLWLRMPGSPVT